jgi:hypothetical protein
MLFRPIVQSARSGDLKKSKKMAQEYSVYSLKDGSPCEICESDQWWACKGKNVTKVEILIQSRL